MPHGYATFGAGSLEMPPVDADLILLLLRTGSMPCLLEPWPISLNNLLFRETKTKDKLALSKNRSMEPRASWRCKLVPIRGFRWCYLFFAVVRANLCRSYHSCLRRRYCIWKKREEMSLGFGETGATQFILCTSVISDVGYVSMVQIAWDVTGWAGHMEGYLFLGLGLCSYWQVYSCVSMTKI